MKKRLNVGLVGLGFIGKIHAIGYRDIALCFPQPQVTANLKAVLRTSLGRDQEFMRTVGMEMETTSMEEFFAQDPGPGGCVFPLRHAHRLRTGSRPPRHSYLLRETPWQRSGRCAHHGRSRSSAQHPHPTWPSPSATCPLCGKMKAAIDSGEFGEVLNFRSTIFHSSYLDPQRPMSWRLRWAESGGGAFADLGAHMVDLVKYLLGDAARVGAKMRTFITERSSTRGSDQIETVDVDDWAFCTMELKNGTIGHIESTRIGCRHQRRDHPANFLPQRLPALRRQ